MSHAWKFELCTNFGLYTNSCWPKAGWRILIDPKNPKNPKKQIQLLMIIHSNRNALEYFPDDSKSVVSVILRTNKIIHQMFAKGRIHGSRLVWFRLWEMRGHDFFPDCDSSRRINKLLHPRKPRYKFTKRDSPQHIQVLFVFLHKRPTARRRVTALFLENTQEDFADLLVNRLSHYHKTAIAQRYNYKQYKTFQCWKSMGVEFINTWYIPKTDWSTDHKMTIPLNRPHRF